ncbi:hypothetical protein J6590_095533 [Homalodisca vitripennis]|nr:hypothetical protein J6590_095533 [Homalodisca vitripennis]
MINNLWNFGTLTHLLAIVGFVFHSYICRKSYRSIITEIASISNELNTNSIRMQKVLFSAFLAIIIVEGIAFYSESGVISQTVSRKILHIAFSSPLLHHVVFADLLTSKFSALNTRLQSINTDINITPLQTISSRIQSVFRLHTHLHVVVWDVNAHFCFYNLLSVTSRLVLAVMQMYQYLMSISEGNTNISFLQIVCIALELALFITQCLLCHACAKEANRTVMIAHHLLQPDTPIELWEEIGLFSRLSLINKVHFSVGGIFSLDRPLITKAAMTSLSYLIIAVQLKDARLSGEVGPNLNGNFSDLGNSTIYNSTFLYGRRLAHEVKKRKLSVARTWNNPHVCDGQLASIEIQSASDLN